MSGSPFFKKNISLYKYTDIWVKFQKWKWIMFVKLDALRGIILIACSAMYAFNKF